MDNITHTLTGLMLSRVGLGGRAKGAAVMMMLAANAPDIDVVGGFRGTLSYLEIHRSYTHSLAFAPLLAAVPMLLIAAFTRTRPSLAAYLGCFVGVLSHLVLDWTNVYGIRMLLPFSARWLRLDITDVIDPWILAILILSLGMPALAGLVSSEIASRKVPQPKRGWAAFALLAVLFYDGGRWILHTRAVAVLGSRLYENGLPLRVTAVPYRSSPFSWRGVIEGEGFVYQVPVNLLEDFDPGAGRMDFPAQSSPAIDAAKKTEAFQAFQRFDQLPFWKLSPLEDRMKVELLDLRFGTPRQPGFEAVALVDPNGRVRESRFTFGQQR